ncbi:MAG: GspE/PulE family protein, partial [Gammaproteobacteria bacterium]
MAERKSDQLSPAQPLDNAELLDALLADGLVSAADAKRLRYSPRTRGEGVRHPLEYLSAQNLPDPRESGRSLDMPALLEWLGKKVGQPVFHIDPLRIDAPAVTAVMSFAFAKRHRILCVESRDDEVLIASAEPMVGGWESDLGQTLRRPIRRVLADPADIERYTVEFYSLARSVSGATGARGPGGGALANFEQLVELHKLRDPDANDQHIVGIVDWILQYAFESRASDIHLEPRREQCNVRFRIDGVLQQVYHLPAAVAMAVTSRLKILGRMDLAEKRRPQDGRIKTRSPRGGEIELRLSTLPTAFGEKLVMRIFDPEVLVRGFRELGLADEDLGTWNAMVEQPHGIVLVTGPTGSGKTTTLYSTLKAI